MKVYWRRDVLVPYLASVGTGDILVCPECEGRLKWDGQQYVCAKCSWTERKAKPPSEPKLPTLKPRKDSTKRKK